MGCVKVEGIALSMPVLVGCNGMIGLTGVYGFFGKYCLSVCRDRNNLEKQ